MLDDPMVQALLLKGQQAKSAKEMLEIHLMLDRFLLDKGSILEDPSRTGQLQALRASADQRDKDEAAFERDKEGFVEGVFTRSEKYKLTGEKADQVRANAAAMYKQARENKLAQRRAKELEVDWLIANGPKRTVTASGHWVQLGSAPNVQRLLKPDVIRVMHRSWTFEPGTNENVPEIFAMQYEQLRQSRLETMERENAMNVERPGGSLHINQLEQKLMEIDQKYGVKRLRVGQGAV